MIRYHAYVLFFFVLQHEYHPSKKEKQQQKHAILIMYMYKPFPRTRHTGSRP